MATLEKNAGLAGSLGHGVVDALGHGVVRGLPIIGALASGYDLAKDLAKGDLVGAGIDSVSIAGNFMAPASMLLTVPLDMYNSSRRAKRDEDMALKQQAAQKQQEHEQQQLQLKYAASNFQRDLQDPRAGADSDLYHAISPLIDGGDASNLSPEELAREQALQEQVRKGLVGLEYMTGLKKNTGNTYYDEHPVAAVGSDILGNAGNIGLGAAALGTGANLLNQYRNFKMTQPSQDARSGNKGGDASHPGNLLNPKEGPARTDIARVFGDFSTDPEKRLAIIDRLNGHAGNHTDYVSKYHEMVAAGKDPKSIFHEATRSPGAAMLEDYANLHESVQRTKAKGGFRKYFGEDLHTSPTAGTANEGIFHKFTREHLAPGHMQGLADLAEAQGFTSNNPMYDRNILKSISEEYSPGAGAKAFAETGLKQLENASHQARGLRKLWMRSKLPIATGAGVALAGTGMYALVKALQKQTHSKQKMNEWKKTLLQSRGDFDRAAAYDTPSHISQHPAIQQALMQSQDAAEPVEDLSSPASAEEQPTPEPAAPKRQEERIQPTPQSSNDIDWSEALNSVR